MDALFRIAPLGEDEVARSFVLVNFYDARVRIEDWRSFLDEAMHCSHPERVAVLIQDQRGYAHAILATWPEVDLRHGKILRVRAVACNAAPGRLLHEAILEAATERAREEGCGGVAIEIESEAGPRAPHGFEASICDAGFSRIGAVYYQPLPRS